MKNNTSFENRFVTFAIAFLLVAVAPFVAPLRADAGAIPAAAVLTLSQYAVEEVSSDDHLTSMTASEPRPSCYGSGARSAWYRITATLKGRMAARVMDYTGIHSVALYRGSSFADAVELGCLSYEPLVSGDFVQPVMRAGESLYLQVIADGTYWVSAEIWPTPFVDNFADAEDLPLGFSNFGGWTAENATVELGEPLPCGGARTAWLKYVPDQTSTVTFTMMDGLNDVLALYRGSSFGDLVLMGCGVVNTFQRFDLSMRVETRLTADVVKGSTYYLQIGATQGPGSFILPLVSRGLPPTNDSVTTAIDLSQNHSVNGTTVAAFTRWLANNCGIWETAWYRVTPLTSGTLEVTAENKPTGSYMYAPALAIHRADTGELLACGADTNASVTYRVPATAGTSYLIAVLAAGHPGDFRMHWEVK
jgi:hypothetical protein